MFKFIWLFLTFSRKRRKDEEEQLRLGYKISMFDIGRELYLTYQESGHAISAVPFRHTFQGTILYVDGIDSWDEPEKKKLTDLEHERVLERLTNYLFRWGEVTHENLRIKNVEETRQDLKDRGIPFEEQDGVIVHQVTIRKDKMFDI